MNDAVTVVVPTRSRPVLLRRTVCSILDQQGADVSVIVVDDASPEPVADSLADIVDLVGSRLTVLRREHSDRVSMVRNLGLSEVSTPWVGFCDDDDLWAPTKVADQLTAMADADTGWSCSGAVAVDPALEPIYEMAVPDPVGLTARLLRMNVIPGGASSVIASTDLVEQLNGFDPDLNADTDWDMWIRLSELAPLAVVDRPHVAYLVHDGSMSLDTGHLEDEIDRIVAKHSQRAEELGVSLDRAEWLDHLSYVQLRAGARVAAARSTLDSARSGGGYRRLATAALSLVSPTRTLALRNKRARQHSDPLALAEVRGWITRYRTTATLLPESGKGQPPVA